MAEFRCTYENHQGEAILGFCVNISCFQTPQFCLTCLKNKQQNHSSQCLGFESIKQCLSEYIQKENQFYGQIKEIENTSKTLFNQLLMNSQNNLKKLQHLKELLQNREYIKFKNEINLFRKYHSKVEETEKSKLLTSINSIVQALQKSTQDFIKIEDQFNASKDVNYQQYIGKAKSRFEQGEQLFKEGKYQEALIAIDDSLSMGYNHDFVYNLKAITLNHLNKYDEAIKCFDQALQMNFNYESAYNNKGVSLNNQGKFEEALQYIEIAIMLNPNNDLAYFNKGFALCNQQIYQDALIAYQKAIDLNNRNDKAHHNKGTTLLKLNRYEDALQCFNTVIDLNNRNDEAFENKALSLHLLSRFNEALIVYDQAIFQKRNANRLKRKADTLLALGRRNEAKQFYYEALRIGKLTTDQEQVLQQLSKL